MVEFILAFLVTVVLVCLSKIAYDIVGEKIL